MAEWTTGPIKELQEDLARWLEDGPVIEIVSATQVIRLSLEHLVERIDGLKVEIFSNEHPPPHFRVSHRDESANFTIRDCEKINGGLDLHENSIRYWWMHNKEKLITVWNRTRPGDCPVGPYRE